MCSGSGTGRSQHSRPMGELQSARRHAASRGQSNDRLLLKISRSGALLCIMYSTDHVPWCKCKAQGLSTERMATALHIWCDAAALRGHPHPAQHQCSVRIMARIGVRQDIRNKGASSGNSKQQQHQRYQDTRRDREKQQRKTTTRPGHERPRRPTLEDDQQQQEKQACRFWC